MKIIFVVGPCLPRRSVCKSLLPLAGVSLKYVNLYDHLIRSAPPEEMLEEKNISLAVSDQFVIDRFDNIIRRHEKTLPSDMVLVINGFPYSEAQACYLAATFWNCKHEIAVLHVEPQVYCRCHDTHFHLRYEIHIRPAALKLAEDFPVFTLPFEEDPGMRLFLLPKVLKMFERIRCKWDGPCDLGVVTKSVEVPDRLSLLMMVLESPNILLECPHVSSRRITG